jgi:ABC-2 type transport system permease protein
MSFILYVIAPIAFDAKISEHPETYWGGLLILIAASLGIASIIGLAVKDTANTSMFSILLFLPSMMLSGIMFPVDLLPKPFEIAGKLFPAAWGYRLMIESTFTVHTLWPLIVIFLAAAALCCILLKKIRTR